MKLSTLLKLTAWLCLFFIGLDLSYYMITIPNTMLNISGVFIFVLTIHLTIKTKCFTNLTTKRK